MGADADNLNANGGTGPGRSGDRRRDAVSAADNRLSGAFRSVGRFFASPLGCGYPPPFTQAGDYVSVAGLACFCVSIFGLAWFRVGIDLDRVIEKLESVPLLNIGVKLIPYGTKQDLLERIPAQYREREIKLFMHPWAWSLIALLVVILVGIWFVQTRGGVTIGAGALCIILVVVVDVLARQKIDEVIGSKVSFLRSIPFIGEYLAEQTETLVKSIIFVTELGGFYLMIAAGCLLILGGSLRLAARPRLAREKLSPQGAK